MATYTIKTTRKQQVGLQFSYDHYADKTAYPTIESYFQSRVDHQVTNPMYEQQQQAQSMSFDQSFQTVPELQQPSAQTEIENVITAHGGTIIPAGSTGPGLPKTGILPPFVPTGTPFSVPPPGATNAQPTDEPKD